MAQKPVLRGEVGCACVAREVSVERGGTVSHGRDYRSRLIFFPVVVAAAVVVTSLARGEEGGGRDYEEAVRVGLKGCARDQTFVSWCSRLPMAIP